MQYLCVEYVCNYSHERCLGQTHPAESTPALGIEFRALLRHLPRLSGAPSRTTIKLGAAKRKANTRVGYTYASDGFYSALFS